MTTIDDGGLAFPCPLGESCEWHHGQSGMSLRDWFAGQALVGLLAEAAKGNEDLDNIVGDYEQCAGTCYLYADHMLAARKVAP